MGKDNCLIVQSGGPTAVINNTLYGIIRKAQISGRFENIYGALFGIQGLLNNQYVQLNKLSLDTLESLRRTPGAALGTLRYKVTEEDVKQMVENMKKRNIHFFFYIGGNGSMYVAHLIEQEVRRSGYNLTVIGVPKSIDNDLLYTDHSPGYGSAAKFLATSVLDIYMDVCSMANSNRITLLETMGRNTGWLAAASTLAKIVKPNLKTLIYIPESAFAIESFLQKVKETYENEGYCIAIISEGIKDKNGKLIIEGDEKKDSIGRPQLGGITSYLTEVIDSNTYLKSRCIVPSIWQRSSMGISSKVDAHEAYQVGENAVTYALSGHSGKMITLKRLNNGNDYQIVYQSVSLIDVAGKESFLPIEWYNQELCQMNMDFEKYALPLIQGEVSAKMYSGLPVYQQF